MFCTLRRSLGCLVALAVGAINPLVLTPTASAATVCPTPARNIIWSAPGSGKTVALSFDDGPGRATPEILKILRRYNVRATFFDTGLHDSQRPTDTKAISGEGHLVADHTWDHRYPYEVAGGWSAAYLHDQFARTNAQQRKLTGKTSCFFRPPGGFLPSGVVAAAARDGMSTVMFSVDTQDWKQASTTTTASIEMIERNARAGYAQQHPIVLMHTAKASHEPESEVTSNRSNTVAALPVVIQGYLDHGYRFVDLNGTSGLPARYTTLSVSTGRVNVPVGRATLAVTGTVRSVSGPVVAKSVRWYSRTHGTTAWTYRGTVLTDSKGVARANDRPARPTDYTMLFRATSGYQEAKTTGFRYLFTYRPAPAVAGVSRLGSCVDGGGVAWRSKVTWGSTYVSSGVTRVSVNFAGWTTTRSGIIPTDSVVKSYDGSGRLLQTLTRTASVNYTGGTFYDARNPLNPPSAPGRAKVTVSTGVDGDGKANCTVTFRQPS
ncbi:hypothetical protein GCM10009841_00680 [Microlunatus panaciterrae]|uniref:Peptidoglycan/xylan/chitin deacetylase (PgdA/CDA1 family) n=1 Tax=Microlunatus panaciterrae TaxID=400768 RepID=A0ABS2RK47_9ACTN|nr:polysaccharide deacetylase family protein [Microlunatus panaciterrae]MBM7799352.1 peptidoglycan/xylan/chitin deacetylase (PgdA/CDA1 family) [Microlunatus panaciterrae]